MPTTRPRYLLTESDDLAAALAIAKRQWPEDEQRPTALLLHLIDAGRRAVDDGRSQWLQARRAAIAHAGDGLEGAFEDDYLARLREDWPE